MRQGYVVDPVRLSVLLKPCAGSQFSEGQFGALSSAPSDSCSRHLEVMEAAVSAFFHPREVLL